MELVRDNMAEKTYTEGELTNFDTNDIQITSYQLPISCGLGSVVGIATGYGLDGLGIESRCGRDFPHLSRPASEATQPPVLRVPGLSWG